MAKIYVELMYKLFDSVVGAINDQLRELEGKRA